MVIPENRLKMIEERYREIEEKLSDQELIKNIKEYQNLLREHSKLRRIVDLYAELKRIDKEIEDNRLLLKEDDPEIRELAEQEIEGLLEQREKVCEELEEYFIERDPRDEKNIILEIRAGAGGEEAALFVSDLFRMYSKYAEKKSWKVEVMSAHPTGLGGFKEIIALIEGKGVFSRLKYESGVHRVQRIPLTESQGRIHTSTVTVAILPEAEEVDVSIDPKDLRIDVFRASGPGGQSVNTTDSAVRITHIPTGISVVCQDEKSQHKNKARAMKILRSRLLELKRKEQEEQISQERRKQVGTGDRSERIRTYNFPQGRVTDHRIGLTIHKLEDVMEGNLDELIDALRLMERRSAINSEAS